MNQELSVDDLRVIIAKAPKYAFPYAKGQTGWLHVDMIDATKAAEAVHAALKASPTPPNDLPEDPEILCGTLIKSWGLKGFHTALPGHPVYQTRDRYIIYLRPEGGQEFTHHVTFYKDTQTPFVRLYT